jgi:hypothetical protein
LYFLALQDAQGASRQRDQCHTPLASPSGAAIEPGGGDLPGTRRTHGPARGSRQESQLVKLTNRLILLLKQTNPGRGNQKNT